MNLNTNPTVEELRELLKRCDDSAGHHVLWVSRAGDVELSHIPKTAPPNGQLNGQHDMQMCFETFQAGNEYVGPDAADDKEWLAELFDNLVKEWPNAKGKAGVAHIGKL